MPKTKISVTVERSVVRDCDRLARGSSRSEVVETALARWARDLRRRSLEDAIENYYASLASAARLEDAQWAELGGRALGETWK
jgi:metal-responsive CopG/Arc/MetJ family transcriptional regulator